MMAGALTTFWPVCAAIYVTTVAVKSMKRKSGEKRADRPMPYTVPEPKYWVAVISQTPFIQLPR